MNKANDLISPTGRPLITEPKIIVLKLPKGVNFHPQMIEQIGKVTGCSVIAVPMECELMMGDIAAKDLNSLHHAIHAILTLPDLTPSSEDIKVLYSALRYLCEKTNPGENSKEVALLKRIKKFAE